MRARDRESPTTRFCSSGTQNCMAARQPTGQRWAAARALVASRRGPYCHTEQSRRVGHRRLRSTGGKRRRKRRRHGGRALEVHRIHERRLSRGRPSVRGRHAVPSPAPACVRGLCVSCAFCMHSHGSWMGLQKHARMHAKHACMHACIHRHMHACTCVTATRLCVQAGWARGA